jgi:hypothetical protein
MTFIGKATQAVKAESKRAIVIYGTVILAAVGLMIVQRYTGWPIFTFK